MTGIVRIALFFVCLIALGGVAHAKGPSHVALVVSGQAYDFGPNLPNAANDGDLVAEAFERKGYHVIRLSDPDRTQMLRTLARARLEARDASQVVVYLAGHGVQRGAEAHYLTRDVPLRADGNDSGIPLRVIIRAFSDKPRQKIILFDACRTGPEIAPVPAGQPPLLAPAGLLIAYAAQPGAVAYDGGSGNGPFAAALTDQLNQPALPLAEFLRKVRLAVVQRTSGRQVPWEQSSLLSEAWLTSEPMQTAGKFGG